MAQLTYDQLTYDQYQGRPLACLPDMPRSVPQDLEHADTSTVDAYMQAPEHLAALAALLAGTDGRTAPLLRALAKATLPMAPPPVLAQAIVLIMAAKKLRKSSDAGVAAAALGCVTAWKSGAKAAASPRPEAAVGAGESAGTKRPAVAMATAAPGAGKQARTNTGGGEVAKTGHAFRDKVRGLLLKALGQQVECPGRKMSGEEGAAAVEQALSDECDDPAYGGAYKAKVKVLLFNLRDVKNSQLRMEVLSGVLSPAELVKMDAQALANPEERERKKKTFDAAEFNSQKPEDTAPTDMFMCPKCKQRKCQYKQAQTRSADEPMTTFVWCMVCNNRWKFC